MRYAELGQITMALAVQMLVDTVLKRSGPADVAVLELRRLLQCIFIGWDGHLSGLEAIHRSSLPELQLALKEAELSMSRAKALSTEADPKQRIMAGPHTPFKIEPPGTEIHGLLGRKRGHFIEISRVWPAFEATGGCRNGLRVTAASFIASWRAPA